MHALEVTGLSKSLRDFRPQSVGSPGNWFAS